MTRSDTITYGKFWQCANTEASPYMWQDVLQDLQQMLQLTVDSTKLSIYYVFLFFSIHNYMNQSKWEVVKQEMARVNADILGISKLKWTGMGEFNSGEYYIYYCVQESLRRNGGAIMVNKRV